MRGLFFYSAVNPGGISLPPMINADNVIFDLCGWRLGFLYIESFKVVYVAENEHYFLQNSRDYLNLDPL